MISLEKLSGQIWWNGSFIPWQDAKIHMLAHSLHYGGAVFEGIRIYDGKAFKLQEHYARLLKSANYLGYDVPYDVATLSDITVKLIAENNLTNGYIRPFAWRGGETLKISADNCKINTAIIAYDPFTGHVNPENGIKMEVSRWEKPSSKAVPCQSKAAGLYMMATTVYNEALANGFQDALMLDANGFIAEATTSNFFFIKEKKLYTPIADTFLNGITRQTVIGIAREQAIKVVEDSFVLDDLIDAEVAFLTGTAAGILKIASIYDKNMDKEFVFSVQNDILSNIITAYEEIVRVA